MTYPATSDYFRRKRKGVYGLDFWCKGCTRVYARKHYYDHQADYQQRSRDWYEANKDRALANFAKTTAANRERANFYSARWAKANKDRLRIRAANRRALTRANGGEISLSEVQQMYKDQGGLCAYCECQLNDKFELDHMLPVIRGGRGDWGNIAACCSPCNRRKAARTVEEFMEVLMK